MDASSSTLCKIINQIFAIETKLGEATHQAALTRKFQRITKHFEELDLYIHNPKGEAYDETRLDCEASISGDQIEHLVITEVIKPIIYYKKEDVNEILQRAIVVVEGQ